MKKNKYVLLLYHLLRPVLDLKLSLIGLRQYPGYLLDLVRYKRKEEQLPIPWTALHPQLHDRTRLPLDYQYFYQQLWAFQHILADKPAFHLDVGSTFELSAYLANFLPVTYVDIRLVQVEVENLTLVQADVCRLPFKDNSQPSISCLHVIEHIGLGRYGDKLNPTGLESACQELTRVLAPNGKLYLSVPVGRERICFNAHRVLQPSTVIDLFSQLKLRQFCVVDDQGQFHQDTKPEKFLHLDYGGGVFLFTKGSS